MTEIEIIKDYAKQYSDLTVLRGSAKKWLHGKQAKEMLYGPNVEAKQIFLRMVCHDGIYAFLYIFSQSTYKAK